MGFSLSPSIETTENNQTTTVGGVSTSIGAIAGAFSWGPVLDTTTVIDEDDLVLKFDKPTDAFYKDFFVAADFLSYSTDCRVVRVVGAGALNASNNASNTGAGHLIKNLTDFEASIAAIGATGDSVFAKYPGVAGNDITVEFADATGYATQKISYSGLAGVLNDGEVITGAPSGATGTLVSHTATEMVLANVVGTFTASDTFSGDGVGTPSGSLDTAPVDAWDHTSRFEYAPTGTNIHVVVLKAGVVKETFTGDTTPGATDFQGENIYIEDILARGSAYIYVDGSNITTELNATLGVATYALKAGADGAQPTDSDRIAGYDLFKNADLIDVNLIMQGGGEPIVGKYVVQNIAEVRKDCVGFLSPSQSHVVGNLYPVETLVELRGVGGILNFSSSYGAMDGNYKYRLDNYNKKYRWIPLNGDHAGLYAATDASNDAWFSAGGFNRGHIKNAVKLAYEPSKPARDQLYKNSVNPIVSFKGEGPVLLGDKTLEQKPSAFSRVNVRRLFIVLEKAIATASKYTLFEFNNAYTRARFVQMVEPFLRLVQGRQGIIDFRVVCDESNNTGQVIDNNEFVGDIYIKPSRSINNIYLNFTAVNTSVDFNEIIG